MSENATLDLAGLRNAEVQGNSRGDDPEQEELPKDGPGLVIIRVVVDGCVGGGGWVGFCRAIRLGLWKSRREQSIRIGSAHQDIK